IDASQELDLIIRSEPCEISCTVQASAWVGTEWIGNESLGREGGLVQVAPRQTLAAEIQLAGSARRDGPTVVVQHVHRPAGERVANRNAVEWPRVCNLEGGGDNRGLGGTVAVHEADVAQRRGLPAADRTRADRFAPDNHQPQAWRNGPLTARILLHPAIPIGRWQARHRDAGLRCL